MSQFLQQIATKLKFYKKQLLLVLISCFVFSITALPVHAATSPSDVPDISQDNSNWVVDQAEVISRINEGKLNDTLEDIADTTGAEMKFVVVRRLNYGETVDSFADNLLNRWYPSPEERRDKVLLVFDTVTNNVTLRVGDDLKDRLSEDIVQSVIKDTIGVPIREDNKYNEAFLNASNRLGTVLAGEPDPGPPQVQDEIQVESTFAKAEETDTENSAVWVVGLLVVATIIPMATYFAYVLLTD